MRSKFLPFALPGADQRPGAAGANRGGRLPQKAGGRQPTLSRTGAKSAGVGHRIVPPDGNSKRDAVTTATISSSSSSSRSAKEGSTSDGSDDGSSTASDDGSGTTSTENSSSSNGTSGSAANGSHSSGGTSTSSGDTSNGNSSPATSSSSSSSGYTSGNSSRAEGSGGGDGNANHERITGSREGACATTRASSSTSSDTSSNTSSCSSDTSNSSTSGGTSSTSTSSCDTPSNTNSSSSKTSSNSTSNGMSSSTSDSDMSSGNSSCEATTSSSSSSSSSGGDTSNSRGKAATSPGAQGLGTATVPAAEHAPSSTPVLDATCSKKRSAQAEVSLRGGDGIEQIPKRARSSQEHGYGVRRDGLRWQPDEAQVVLDAVRSHVQGTAAPIKEIMAKLGWDCKPDPDRYWFQRVTNKFQSLLYMCRVHGQPMDEMSRRPSVHYLYPMKRKIQEVFLTLPDCQGTGAEVCDAIERDAAYSATLDRRPRLDGKLGVSWKTYVYSCLTKTAGVYNTGTKRNGAWLYKYEPSVPEADVHAARRGNLKAGQAKQGLKEAQEQECQLMAPLCQLQGWCFG